MEQNSLIDRFGRKDCNFKLFFRIRDVIMVPIISANRMIKEKKVIINILFPFRINGKLSFCKRLALWSCYSTDPC